MKKNILAGALLSIVFAFLAFSPALAQQTPPLSEAEIPSTRIDGWWFKRHGDNVDKINNAVRARENVELLMIGDSITHGWEGQGKDVWEKYYAHRKPVNLGFSGDRTQHVLWRLEQLPFSRISPKAAVIMIGTNNVNSSTPKETADGIKAIVNKLQKQFPEMKILVLKVFPRDNKPDGNLRVKVDEINSFLPDLLKDEKNVTLLDINHVFLDGDGVLQPAIMADFLHPGEAGYALWAEAVEPTLAKLLGDEEVKK